MNGPPPRSPSTKSHTVLVAGILLVSAVLAYHNTFSVPFLFDDVPAIVNNPSIRDLGAVGTILAPHLEGGVTTNGRPVLNLSFAVSHAIGGYDVRGYHAMNLAIHVLAALTLFGILRRIFTPYETSDIGATVAAAAAAEIWMLHPLQTSAVTYLAQRAESLCGLFLLVCIWTFVRATESSHPWRWLTVSVTACTLGMGTKEVMVVAPIVVFAFDRTFVAGSFSKAWGARRVYYLALAGTWLVLAAILTITPGRGTTAGFETTVTPWIYLLTQSSAIVRYLELAVWPHALIFDYGTPTVHSLTSVWWQATLLLALVVGTVWALIKKPVVGFGTFWFLALLAPSSSFVPVASQTIAEHRMYLPLAAVVVFFVATVVRLLNGRFSVGSICVLLAVVLGVTTESRNNDYRSARSIWEDTAGKAPSNPRANINLALELTSEGRDGEALHQIDMALESDPRSADAHYNRGVILARRGQVEEATAEYDKAIANFPNHAEALNNLGSLRYEHGDLAGAEECYRRSLAARPGYADAHGNLSAVLLDSARVDEALQEAERAVQGRPDWPEGEFRRGNALLALGRMEEARAAFARSVDLDPTNPDAQNNLGNLLAESGEFETALRHYQAAILSRPDMIAPRRNTALILAHLGRVREAITQLEELVRLQPANQDFRERLADLRDQIR